MASASAPTVAAGAAKAAAQVAAEAAEAADANAAREDAPVTALGPDARDPDP